MHVKLNCPGQICPRRTVSVHPGEMAEWLKAHAWKACLGETLTRVRIPLSPPEFYNFPVYFYFQELLSSWCLRNCKNRHQGVECSVGASRQGQQSASHQKSSDHQENSP